jgi:hypothetical protein
MLASFYTFEPVSFQEPVKASFPGPLLLAFASTYPTLSGNAYLGESVYAEKCVVTCT